MQPARSTARRRSRCRRATTFGVQRARRSRLGPTTRVTALQGFVESYPDSLGDEFFLPPRASRPSRASCRAKSALRLRDRPAPRQNLGFVLGQRLSAFSASPRRALRAHDREPRGRGSAFDSGRPASGRDPDPRLHGGQLSGRAARLAPATALTQWLRRGPLHVAVPRGARERGAPRRARVSRNAIRASATRAFGRSSSICEISCAGCGNEATPRSA